MTNDLKTTPSRVSHTELKRLFGRPPILSTESLEAYQGMTDQFLACVRPGDFIELMFVKDLAVFESEVLRLTRHKAWAIERRFRKRLEYQNSRKVPMIKPPEKPTTGLERLDELEEAIEAASDDVDTIFKQTADEFDHAQGLEDGIDYFERLDRLLNQALARRNDCLEQISRYRAELGRELQRRSDTMLDEIIYAGFERSLEAGTPIGTALPNPKEASC